MLSIRVNQLAYLVLHVSQQKHVMNLFLPPLSLVDSYRPFYCYMYKVHTISVYGRAIGIRFLSF